LIKFLLHFVLKTGHFIHQIGSGGSADPSDPPLDPLLNISKQISFLTLPKRCRYASKLFLQNIHYTIFFLLFKKGAGTPYRRLPSQKGPASKRYG